MTAASSLASSSSLQLPLWSVEALAGEGSFDDDDDRDRLQQQQQHRHRLRHTRLADEAAAVRGMPRPSPNPSPTPDALIHQANALLGQAGLLAAAAGMEPDDSKGLPHPTGAGVPPLGSMADLRAAAPALAVAVFEALLQMRLRAVIRRPASPEEWAHNVDVVVRKLRPLLGLHGDADGNAMALDGVDGGAVALRGEPAAIAGLLGALEGLARMVAPRLLFGPRPVKEEGTAAVAVIDAEEVYEDERGSGGGWEGDEASEWQSGAASSMPSAYGSYGYSSGSGSGSSSSSQGQGEEGPFLYEDKPSYVPVSAPAPEPPPQRLLASDVRRVRLRRQARLHAVRVARARAMRQAQDEAAHLEAERLRRETAAELASRRVARALLREWAEYRREEEGGGRGPREGQRAGAPASVVGVDRLPLRAKTMRTLYPRLHRELLRLLPTDP